MYISCNRLKKHIKNSDKIDWLKIWDDFTIKTAEVEGFEIKGEGLDGIVVGEVKSCTNHPKSDHLHICEVYDGKDNLQIVCGAPNVRAGLKVALIKVGGHIDGFEITARPLVGVVSNGMICSGKELGISDDHEGILELPDYVEVGKNINEYLPLKDIIVEIDNKSLTNRPDLWSHYGIAREVAAITGNELLPLDLEEVTARESLNIEVIDKENCLRYSGIGISNVKEKKAPLDMQVMLYYCGMRSISLLVDLTNYIMLELGQPLHAFDNKKVNKVVVKQTDGTKFTTLDGVERDLPRGTLMITDGEKDIAIAGIMGGLNSEIDPETDSLLLEAATFDAGCIRRSAIKTGLRTEASARYEKALDPNMTEIAIKRFLYLLKQSDKNISIDTKITDVYSKKVTENIIELDKTYLRRYMGFDLDEKTVKEILTSLDFKVEIKNDTYLVTAPTYRSTKDISNKADIVEEIARIYGYNNLTPKPLKLDLVVKKGDGYYKTEYDIKKFLAKKTKYHEIHTYIWYSNNLLERFGIDKKENITLQEKKDNTVLRDSLSLSLFEKCITNSKNNDNYGIFEIGSVIQDKENRVLSIMHVCQEDKLEDSYYEVKKVVYDLFKQLYGKSVTFKKGTIDKVYANDDYTLLVEGYGYITCFKKSYTKACSKKTCIINAEISIEKLMDINVEAPEYKEISKYPNTTIDYTIILDKETLYEVLEKALNELSNEYIKDYKLVDVYSKDTKNITIRFTLGSNEKTLSSEEIENTSKYIMETLEEKGYKIVK